MDFIVGWTDLSTPVSQGPIEYWIIYFDGSLKIDGAGAGALFISPTKEQLRYVLKIYFPASNNAAEYEACLHGLRIASELGVKRLLVYGDSALVINQLNKDWDTTSDKMDAYCKAIQKLESKFYGIEYSYVVRDKNQATDALSKLGSSCSKVPHGVFIQDLLKPSVHEEGDNMVEKTPDQQLVATILSPAIIESSLTTTTTDWRAPFVRYLTDGSGPTDKIEVERLMHRSNQYILLDGKLMRKNAKEEILMKCITQEDGIKLLKEIHAGTCGNHAALQTLVGKAFRAGFYWPSAISDAEKVVRHRDGC